MLTSTEFKRKHPLAECEVCPLYSKPCAKTTAPRNPSTAFVSRSPGHHEAMHGRPFSGPSGDVLNYLLKENGIHRDDILLTNVVLCAPDAGKVPPEAIKACAPRLRAELQGIKLVIAAGSEAVSLIIGRGAIERFRGYRIQQDGRIVVATNNPALVLRDDSTFPNLRKDFRRAFNPLPEPVLPTVRVIEDGDEARDYIANELSTTSLLSGDIESRGGLSHKATIVSLQFAFRGDSAVVFGERGGLWNDTDFIDNHLRPLFEDRDRRFIWHNGVFDVKILRYGYGIQARVDEDTLLMNYACDERGGVHALEYCLMEEFGWPNYEPDSVKQFKRDGIVRDYNELHTYAGWDAAGTYQMWDRLRHRMDEERTNDAYERLLREGIESIARIELAGFRYNVEAAADLMENEVGPEIKEQELKLRTMIDKPLYNPASPKQTAILFYDEWKIGHNMRARPDMGRSVDDPALSEIVNGRFTTRIEGKPLMQSFAKELKRYRSLTKQASTYIVGMIERAIDDPEGRIYTDLLLHGTVTGRPSSRNPNLLNITRTKPGLPDIRKLFIPSNGRQIVVADYSQAELRTIGWLSQDSELLRVYQNNEDLHSLAAARFYGEKFTSEQRSRAKNMNFGVAYGQGAATFQEKHEIPEKEAQRFIDWWWLYFKGVKDWKRDIIKEMRTGRVTTPFGRVRRFHLLTKENVNTAIREAVNFKPQSIAADFTLRAVIVLGGGYKVPSQIDHKRANIILTVYDSIIADVEESYVDEYKRICKEVMESRPKDELGWTIPFEVDIGSGDTWADAK